MNSIGTGMLRRENLGDARSHSAGLLMLLDRYDRAAARAASTIGRLVHRLDGMVVDDAAFDAVLAREASAAMQRVVDENAASDDRDVAALAKRLRFADLEWRLVGRYRPPISRGRNADRPGPTSRRARASPSSSAPIARYDDRHVRDDAHDRDILDRLMRRAVGTDRDAGVRSGNLYVGFVERHDRAHLLPRASRIEHRIARDPRNLSDRREAAGHRNEHLLGDADLDVLLRVRFLEAFEPRRLRKIRADSEHVAVARARLDQSFAEAVARRNLLELGRR